MGERGAFGEDEALRTVRVGGKNLRASVVWRLENRVRLEGHSGVWSAWGGAPSDSRWTMGPAWQPGYGGWVLPMALLVTHMVCGPWQVSGA